MHAHTGETKSQRAARQRRQSAERARAYRSRLKELRRPLPRVVDAALVESLGFHLLQATENGRPSNQVLVSTLNVGRLAVRILVRDGYDHAQAAIALTERLESWAVDHRAIGHVPTLSSSSHVNPDRLYPRGQIMDSWLTGFFERWQTQADDEIEAA